MINQIKLVVFYLDGQIFALHLNNLERVIQSVEIKPITMSPPHVTGTINIQGEFLPVISVRKLFSLPVREIELSDHFMIVRSTNLRMVLWVDSVGEIVTIPEDQIGETSNLMLDSAYIDGIFKFHDGLVLINDLDKFLTAEQIIRLAEELAKHGSLIAK